MDVVQKEDRGMVTDNKKIKRVSKKPRKETDTLKRNDDISENEEDKQRKPETKKKLRRKWQEVACENENLAEAIHNKNQEISDLKRSVQSLNDVLNSVPIDELRCNSSIASTKLLELSKKNRQLRAELETAKNRANKKDLQIQKLEHDAIKLRHDGPADGASNSATQTLNELQNKMNALQQKLFETRNKNTELQTQLKLAQKCLQQEVGEQINLNLLASQTSNWRGRAQQILHLQQKVHELKDRLDLHERHSIERVASYSSPQEASSYEMIETLVVRKNNKLGKYEDVNAALSANTSSSQICNSSTHSALFDRFSPGVRKTEILHRAKVETLEKEIDTLKTQLEEQRNKILALKVRNKTLNDEMIKYKLKSCSMAERSDYNDLNLTTMNEKLNLQKSHYENRLEEMNRELTESVRLREQAEYSEVEMHSKMTNLEHALSNKETYIEELNGIIKKLETDLKAVCGDFLFSCRELRKEEFIAILDSLESEKNQLVVHNKTLKERVEQERNKNENCVEQLSKQKVRITRLEAKIRELEKEIEVTADRKKRSQRIADYANSFCSATSINGSLNSFVFENPSVVSVASNAAYAKEVTPAQFIDIKNQLELATERIILLQDKLTHMAAEKENDAKTFEDILINSKSIILETILTNKSNEDIRNVDNQSSMNDILI